MAWRQLAYGSQQAAEAAPAIIPTKDPSQGSDVPQVDASMNDGLKIYNILKYLRSVPNHEPKTVDDIYKNTGINLRSDEAFVQRLKNNPKIRPIGQKYAYQAKYDIKNRDQLLKALNRIPEGIPSEDLDDCYHNIEADLNELSHSGEIICIKSMESQGGEVYYARGKPFLVNLSGNAIVEPGCYVVHTEKDVSEEVRRGDAVRLGEHWFRVSSAVRSSSGSRPGPFSGAASRSVSSVRDPNVSKKIRYTLKMDKERLPLDKPFPDPKRRPNYTSERWDCLPKRGPKMSMTKHGCTNDIRQLWQDTLRHWPTDRNEFDRRMVQAGLTTQAKVDANRRTVKRRLKADQKKKNARPRKARDIKISNQHLIGTELGELLAKGEANGSENFTLGAVKFDKK